MENWQENLSEEQRNHPTMTKFMNKGIGDVVQSYIELENWKGGAVKIPTADSPASDFDDMVNRFQSKGIKLAPVPDWSNDDQVKAFNSAIGVPEEYELDGLDGDALTNMQGLAGKLGLTQRQASLLTESMLEMAEENQGAMDALANEKTEALKSAWGASHEQRHARIATAAKEMVGQEVEMNAAGYLMLDKLLDAIQGTPQGEQIASGEVGPTKEELREKIETLRSKMTEPDYRPDIDTRRKDLARIEHLTELMASA